LHVALALVDCGRHGCDGKQLTRRDATTDRGDMSRLMNSLPHVRELM
jgi:hypothetical protein